MSRRWSYLAALLLLVVATIACARGRASGELTAVDLLRRLPEAERRPAGGTFDVEEHTFGGQSRASAIVPANSRLTWLLLVPHRSRLVLYAAVPDTNGPAAVAVRIGVSDDRIYNTLVEPTITTADTAARGWVPVVADLSFYAGRKLSLFYRPDQRRWEVIVATRVLSGAPPVVYLGTPALVTDLEGAREYRRRVARAGR